MNKSERAQIYADDWVYWLRTRRFFGPANQKHILAVLSEPDTGGEPPDAPMSAEMAAFHVGVCSLDDKEGSAFIRVYCGWPKQPIKALAYSAGITPVSYYNMAHKAAEKVLRAQGHALAMVENLGLREYKEKPIQNMALYFHQNLIYSL